MELTWGLHLFGARFFDTDFGDRVVGTLLQPSSLGVFAVLAASAAWCFAAITARYVPVVLAVAGVVVFFTASATALALWFLVCGWWLWRYVQPARGWLWCGVGLAVLLLYFLPDVLGRSNVFDSLWGRIWLFEKHVLLHVTATELWWGQGLGAGSNAALNAVQYGAVLPAELLFVADSTVAALIAQIGVVGCLCFYSLVVLAAWHDALHRPVYAVLLLASLSINIVEFFPAVVVLGLLLARYLHHSDVQAAR